MTTRKGGDSPKRGGKVGRPSKYRDDYPEQAKKLCMLGATNEDLARSFGVGLATLNRWIAEIDAFRDALKAGREVADAEVASRLYRRAIGYSHPAVKIMQNNGVPIKVDYIEHYPPDPTSMIFWLKNRRPDLWRDKPAVVDGDEAPPPVRVTVNIQDARVRVDEDSADAEPSAG